MRSNNSSNLSAMASEAGSGWTGAEGCVLRLLDRRETEDVAFLRVALAGAAFLRVELQPLAKRHALCTGGVLGNFACLSVNALNAPRNTWLHDLVSSVPIDALACHSCAGHSPTGNLANLFPCPCAKS